MKILLFVMLLTSCDCGDGAGGGGDDDDASPDTTAPTIVSRTPAPDVDDVWRYDPIEVVFSEAMDPASISDATVTLTDTTTGNAVAYTSSLSDDGTRATFLATGAVETPGGLRLSLGEGVTDVAGNALAPEDWQWSLPLWALTPSLGEADEAENVGTVATGRDGTIWVAWKGFADGISRVRVARVGPSGAVAAGDGLGDSTVNAPQVPQIAPNTTGGAVVVWHDAYVDGTSAVKAARWDGAAWAALPDLGAGTFPAVASDAAGRAVVVWRDMTAGLLHVRRLEDDAWTTVADPTPPFPMNDYPSPGALAVDSAGRIVFAYRVDDPATGSPLAAIRIDGAATVATLPYLNVHLPSVGNWPTLAAVGDEVWASWEENSGFESDVHVARLDESSGTPTWTPVGHPLDVDPASEARFPSLAAGADGTAYVSWNERSRRELRNWVARWDGAEWVFVGGAATNLDPNVPTFASPLAVHPAGVPVVAWHEFTGGDWQAATVHVKRYNGRSDPLPGLAAPEPTTCSFDPLDPQATQTLSSTGCFDELGPDPVPAPGLVFFDINAALWSDGARKRRWILLPEGETISAPNTGAWQMPLGTMIVKEFSLEMTEGDPSTIRPVETRFLVKTGDVTWMGFSYQWNDAGDDADLLLGDVGVTKGWGSDLGGLAHTHYYPSRVECTRCHNEASGFMLGLQTAQLDRRVSYGDIAEPQLDALERAGVVAIADRPARFTPPYDYTESAEDRVRGYLAANCAHCHRPGGERPTRDFRFETALLDTQICAGEVVPTDPAGSLMYQRMSVRPGMPAAATLVVDPFALDLVSEWIAEMTTCP